MKKIIFFTLSLGCCWIFSPESLALAGNIAGQVGWTALPLLLLISLCFAAPQLPSTSPFILYKKSAIQIIGTNGLTLAACLPLVILSATALLVTAGYTFNEVFLYWFPNFGFAFLLLSLLTFLQLLSERIILSVQVLHRSCSHRLTPPQFLRDLRCRLAE
ncbi:MAG: hypothetical protein D3923_17980 [Candidatus Electrothrix sp. AR3]|nr:hypothetical protein [Candidatus Electrothrix sp. AR3]